MYTHLHTQKFKKSWIGLENDKRMLNVILLGCFFFLIIFVCFDKDSFLFSFLIFIFLFFQMHYAEFPKSLIFPSDSSMIQNQDFWNISLSEQR